MEKEILLRSFLETNEEKLITEEEKIEYIKKIEDLWAEVPNELKTEELFLKVLNRVKAYKFKGVVWNKDGVLRLYQGFPKERITKELYLDVLQEVKDKVFSNSDYHYSNCDTVKSMLEIMPTELKNREGYLAILKRGTIDFYDVSQICKTFIPEEIRNKEFYEELLSSLEENEIRQGHYFWDLMPEEMKSRDLFMKFISKIDCIQAISIIQENIDLVDTNNLVEIFDLVTKKKNVSGYYMNRLQEVIPSQLYNEKIYIEIMDKLLDDNASWNIKENGRMNIHWEDYKFNFFLSMPKNCQTEELFFKVLDKLNIGTLVWQSEKFKFPEEFVTSKVYFELIKRITNDEELKKGKDVERYSVEFLKKIPPKLVTAEMLIELATVLDESILFKEITELESQFKEKDLYPSLMEEIAKRSAINYSDFFKKIPKEYINEQNLLKMFRRIKQDAYKTFRLFDSISKEKFSKEFYYELISNNKVESSIIFKSMPEEYRTAEIFFEHLRVNANNAIDMNICPLDREKTDTYYKIMDYIFSLNEISNSDKFKRLYEVISSIHYLRYDVKEKLRLAISEQAIEKVRLFKDEKQNVIYTPKEVFEIFGILLMGWEHWEVDIDEKKPIVKEFLDKTKVLEYIDEVIEKEEDNILKGESNEEQIEEYEKELEIDNTDKSLKRNPFWALNTVYYLIPQQLQYKYKEKIREFFKNNIYRLQNGNNGKTVEFIKKILTNNEDLFTTLDNRFLENDKYINKLGNEKYEVIVAYPDIQSIIAEYDDHYFELFSSCIEYSTKFAKSKEAGSEDWIPIADALCRNLQNKDFKKLNDEISKINFKELTEEIKSKYLNFITKEKNWFDINTIEELEKYEEIKRSICQKILEEPEQIEGIPNDIKRLKKDERIIFARLQLQFGLDIIEARNLVEKYAKGLNENQKAEKIGELLLNLEKIINVDEEEIEELRKFDIENAQESNYEIFMNLEARCRESYLKEYNKTLYIPNNQLEENKFEAEYEGKKLQVFEVKDDFNMIIHVLGAYSDKSRRNDYKEDWNIPKIGNHGLCASFIGNNNLGTARVANVIYGFSDFSPEQLLLSSAWDIISREANTVFSTSSVKYNYRNGVKFFAPKEQLDNTRHTHNEIVFERRQYKEGELSKKMQPAYIVYIPDYLEGKKDDEINKIMENRDEVLKKYMESDLNWQETQKAAAQFGVPIVMVDRAACAERESQKIEELVKEFEKTKNANLISEIINQFESNRSGNREYHKKVMERYFSKNKLEGYLARIEKVISEMPTKNQRKNMYENFKIAFDSEVSKRLAFRKTEEDPITQYWQDKSFGIYTKEKKNLSADEIEIEQVIDELTSKGNIQVSGVSKDIIDEIKDMKSRKLYEDKMAHSDRHIQDVMLFASILGENNNLDLKYQLLLVEAAKFHDAGRKSDDYRNHAEAGAIVAGEKLNEKYDEQELAIIQIAIEYHEHYEFGRGKLDENKLKELFAKYKLKQENQEVAKIVSEYLKDADALDRTRFVGKAKLDSQYLHSESAKSLIELANSVNEEYAKRDLEEICSANEELRDSIEKFREKQNGSNLLTIWAIRHHKFIPKKNVKASMDELYEVAIGVPEEDVLKVQKEIVGVERTEKGELSIKMFE